MRCVTRKLVIGVSDQVRQKKIFVAKTKALISCAVTAQLICAFAFAYAKKQVFSQASSYDCRRFWFCSIMSLLGGASIAASAYLAATTWMAIVVSTRGTQGATYFVLAVNFLILSN